MSRTKLFTMRVSVGERQTMDHLAKRLGFTDVAEMLRGFVLRGEARRGRPGVHDLRRASITVRDDGKLDVVRERASSGETIKGCSSLEEAFDAIRAHDPIP